MTREPQQRKKQHKVSKHDTMEWLKHLRSIGIKRYRFGDLPIELRSNRFHRKAISLNAIKPLDTDRVSKIYEIPQSVEKYSSPAQIVDYRRL